MHGKGGAAVIQFTNGFISGEGEDDRVSSSSLGHDWLFRVPFRLAKITLRQLLG